ncbi:MAG TPA: UDP-N-acetylglucosamine 2-epimerase (non-hydrolyzing) [Burkholderiaceae bacterium]
MMARALASSRRHVLCVVGARPNFVKMAPIVQAFANLPEPVSVTLVHTGQHYGSAMTDRFFDTLGLPEPDFNLEVGSASHALQTAEIMRRFEPVLLGVQPDAVLVAGDVNSTLACALVSQKLGIPVIHVEAGLRSYDRAMPEEINRTLTDHLADLLLTSEPAAQANLAREGIRGTVEYVGNVMIDSLLAHLPRALPLSAQLAQAGRAGWLQAGEPYAVMTAHRPSNVDDYEALSHTLALARAVADKVALVFPLHPRTRAKIVGFGLEAQLAHPRLYAAEPLGYLEMLGAMRDCVAVITDSGGMQEEALVLGVPCITLRDTTERPVTLDCGGNVLVADDHDKTLAALDGALRGLGKPQRKPALWDGQAASRIASATARWLETSTRSIA